MSNPVNKHNSQMAHSVEKSEIIAREIAKLLKKGVIKECDREMLFLLSLLGGRKMEACAIFQI